MDFFCGSQFYNSYKELISNIKHYKCLQRRFYDDFFTIKSTLEIWDAGYLLNNNGSVRLSKIRLKGCTNKGKSSGFRIIVLINRETNSIYFIEVYPKIGPLGKDNLKPTEIKEILDKTLAEKESGILFVVKATKEADLTFIK